MAKSYKVCTVQQFDVPDMTHPFPVKAQFTMPGIPEEPQTNIFKARDIVDVEDFTSLLIEHEHEVSTIGRINAQRFSKYIRKGIIHGYTSHERNLLLLSGKKDDILSFCRYTQAVEEIRISTLRIDMKALLAKLAEIKIVWFRFPKGMIHASALMGSNLEQTSDFRKAKTQGEITTLSFYFQDNTGMHHPIMVTEDGAVVVMDPYQEVANEIDIVLGVFDQLLTGTFVVEPIVFKPSKKRGR